MATTIPQQLYVTVQYRGDTNNESGLLGFASPYTRDAAFEKRKHTQDNWAYGHGITVTIDAEDNVSVTGEGSSGYGRANWDAGALFIANCFPRIIPNEPQEGFELAKSVRRYGWGGSGNVVWRITDPRGFDLEITSENFASILNCAVVDHGVIQGKCVWGREGSRNVLLPENSEPYQAAMKQTEKVSKRVSLRDVQLGDTVEIISSQLGEDDQTHVYLAKYYFIHSNYNDTSQYNLAGEYRERYVLQSKLTGEYQFLSSLKISQIVERTNAPREKADVAQELNQLSEQFHLALPRAPCAEDIKFQVVSHAPVTLETWQKFDTYRHQSYLIDYQGRRCLANLSNYSRGAELYVNPVTFDAETGVIRKEMDPVNPSNHYWGRSYSRPVQLKNDDITQCLFHSIQISSQGYTRRVKYIPA